MSESASRALRRPSVRRIVPATVVCICMSRRRPATSRSLPFPHAMTERSAKSRPVRASRAVPPSASPTLSRSEADTIARYVDRGRECAFANARLLGRVVTTFYDEALKPIELRASQLALMWAVLACEPVEMGRLGEVTQTDQTTLSRTIDKLRRAGLVDVEAGQDRRVRLLRLTARGRRQFARAMPLWEAAQREVDGWLSITTLRDLARKARRLGSVHQ